MQSTGRVKEEKRYKRGRGVASFYHVIRPVDDCRPSFFRVYFSTYFRVFNAVTRNFCPCFRPLALRLSPSTRRAALLLSPCRQRVARVPSTESLVTRYRGCAIANTVGKPGEPDQLQYRDTQTYWRNSRNLREAFGIPRWRVSA